MEEVSLDRFIHVSNNSGTPKKVIIEPWADEWPLQPGEKCVIAYFTDPAFQQMDVEYTDELIVVYFDTGAIAEFVGTDLPPRDWSSRVPAFPRSSK